MQPGGQRRAKKEAQAEHSHNELVHAEAKKSFINLSYRWIVVSTPTTADNALFLRELMILSYNSDIDGINGNGVAKSNDMNSMSRYTTSILKGTASKRRIYPDSYTKICFHMFPTEL